MHHMNAGAIDRCNKLGVPGHTQPLCANAPVWWRRRPAAESRERASERSSRLHPLSTAFSVRWDAGRDARAAGRRTSGGRRRRQERNRHADVQSGRPDGHQTRLALRPRALRTSHRPCPQDCQPEVFAESQRPTRKSPTQVGKVVNNLFNIV